MIADVVSEDGLNSFVYAEILLPERLEMASFTHALHVDSIRLLVPGVKDALTFADLMRSPFQPLEAEVWLALALTVFYVG